MMVDTIVTHPDTLSTKGTEPVLRHLISCVYILHEFFNLAKKLEKTKH